MRRQSVIALIAISIIFIGSALPVRASSPSQAVAQGGITLIALDNGAWSNAADFAAAESAAVAVAAGVREGTVGIVRYGTGRGEIITRPAGSGAVDAVRAEMIAMRSQPAPGQSDQFGILTEAFSYLTRINAPAGSEVFLVTPGRILGESENTRDRLRNVGQLFRDEAWPVNVATLHTSEAVLRELMAALPAASDGQYFDMATSEGADDLLAHTLGIDLAPVMDVELGSGPSAATVQVAPMTDRLDVVFKRSSRDVAATLFRPNGAPATVGMPNVAIIESPAFVIVSVDSPVAGTWSLQASGAGAKVSAGVQADNPISLALVDQPPLPVGEQGRLMASPFVNGIAQPMPGAHIVARVRHAGGQSNVYELHDSGVDGDEQANDGIFSAILPEPEAQGVNDVMLELRWEAFGAVIKSAGTFQTEVFPSLTVSEIAPVEAAAGDLARVADVQVRTGQFPYPVAISELTVKFSGPEGEVDGELQPLNEVEPGKAWQYAVYAALPESGDYSMTVSLGSEYVGRSFVASSSPTSVLADITSKPLTIAGLPFWAFMLVLVVVAAVALTWFVISRKTRPFGYLYDDQDRLIVDFGRLRRSPLRRLLSADVVTASEVPSLPFRGAAFRFQGQEVELRYQRVEGDPSIRVNSRPAGPAVKLGRDVWLGVGGRLLTFVAQRKPTANMPAPADD